MRAATRSISTPIKTKGRNRKYSPANIRSREVFASNSASVASREIKRSAWIPPDSNPSRLGLQAPRTAIAATPGVTKAYTRTREIKSQRLRRSNLRYWAECRRNNGRENRKTIASSSTGRSQGTQKAKASQIRIRLAGCSISPIKTRGLHN